MAYLAAKRGLYLGTATDWDDTATPDHGFAARDLEIMSNTFSVIVPDTELKWEVLFPNDPGDLGASVSNYQFSKADYMVAWAARNKQEVRGTALVWDNLPPWLHAYAGNATALQTLMVNRIQTTVGRYKLRNPGTITSWDVVNEPIGDTNNDVASRNSIWSAIGSSPSDYILLAFQTAYAADPTARLCLNDYPDRMQNADGTLITYSNGNRWDADFNLIKAMNAAGAHINCFGMEGHAEIGNWGLANLPNYETLVTQFARFANIGVEVQITEADFEFAPVPHLAKNPQLALRQWQIMVSACLASLNCTLFNFWNYTDRYSEINHDTAMVGRRLLVGQPYNLVDDFLNPTDVYFEIEKLLTPRERRY